MKGLYILFAVILITSCQNQSKEDLNKAKQASIDSMKVEINKQRVIDSMKTEMAKIKEEQKAESQKEKVVVVQQPANGQAVPAATAKKKGWSATAKGAVIGAGVGAATGAIVSKKKGEGAIIGGLAGAALGTGTGAVIDSKNKKKE
ncbi:YMGG-like glycine zipper-containing protein [Flavobacterium johnsoniae]|uniref:Glycine zipper n=1 Tax=Flavobacterium johnsoniae TaxID=986 RepID=A0A1M5T868_FLAJO|nr:YMGG-like glycine zipper-containing protein [Flavobacterium johnsoniae]SHH46967.1 Glycine zipper [Flavobacterium johnsoniae]